MDRKDDGETQTQQCFVHAAMGAEIERLRAALGEIPHMTQRSDLETGFNHRPESIPELKRRLSDIAGFCEAVLARAAPTPKETNDGQA